MFVVNCQFQNKLACFITRAILFEALFFRYLLSTMQYLSPVYAILLFFGHKTRIKLEDFIYYAKNLSGLCSFRTEVSTPVLH